MPFTGSESDLKQRLIDELEGLLTDDESKDAALEHLETVAEAIANAVVGWVLANGKKSLVAATVGQGQGMGAGAGNLGSPIVTKVTTSTTGIVDLNTVELV